MAGKRRVHFGKNKKVILIAFGAVFLFALAYLLGSAFFRPEKTGLPDPSAVYCSDVGGRYLSRENSDGSEYGVCALPDGTFCDSWLLFSGGCPPYEKGPGAESFVDPSVNFESCSSDSECAPAGDCHPRACVSRDSIYANKSGGLCTEVCLGPLDCGAGHCGCVLGKCAVVPNG